MKIKFGDHIVEVKKIKIKPCCRNPDIVIELYQDSYGGKGLMKPTFKRRRCKNCGNIK